jgi:hypothetical protein
MPRAKLERRIKEFVRRGPAGAAVRADGRPSDGGPPVGET